MKSEGRQNLFIYLLGIICGYIFAITITYPLYIEKYEEVMPLCGKNNIAKLKISIIGDIREVHCKNGFVFRLGGSFYPLMPPG